MGEREQLDAERAVYQRLISSVGLSASDFDVEDYDLTDHLELYFADGRIVSIRVDVTLP